MTAVSSFNKTSINQRELWHIYCYIVSLFYCHGSNCSKSWNPSAIFSTDKCTVKLILSYITTFPARTNSILWMNSLYCFSSRCNNISISHVHQMHCSPQREENKVSQYLLYNPGFLSCFIYFPSFTKSQCLLYSSYLQCSVNVIKIPRIWRHVVQASLYEGLRFRMVEGEFHLQQKILCMECTTCQAMYACASFFCWETIIEHFPCKFLNVGFTQYST